MLRNYVTVAEAKAFLGIGGSSKDARLAVAVPAAAKMLDGILSVSTLARHRVSGEAVSAMGRFADLRDLNPVRLISAKFSESGDAFDAEVTFDGYRMRWGEDDRTTSDLTSDYAAGWAVGGECSFTVTDASALSGKKLTLVESQTISTDLVENVAWHATAGDSASTAASIAAALSATRKVDAWSEGPTVYACDITPGRETLKVTTDASTGIGIASGGVTLNGCDFPEDLKMAAYTIIGDLVNSTGNSNVKSYTVGGKSVMFSDATTAATVKSLIGRHMRASVFGGRPSVPAYDYRK